MTLPFQTIQRCTQLLLFYETLDVDVIPCYVHMLKTNCHIVVYHVFLLVIALVKRVIGALIP